MHSLKENKAGKKSAGEFLQIDLYLTFLKKYFSKILGKLLTVGKKSIRALKIVLAIFLCFECQFLSFYACYKEYKA